ncbi:hypothetical protein AAKU55_003621 [Oxalobacteraceae bacterium GrIS 1.11]
MSASFATGRPRGKREVVDVPEMKAPDRTLDRLIGVRKHRLERLERESLEARPAWRGARAQLRDKQNDWRLALQLAQDFWQGARKQFFAMEITSGQFRAAKGGFKRLTVQAAQRHLECREILRDCRVAGSAFFAAKQRLFQAKHQQEKLNLFRDQLRLAEAQDEY